LVIARFFLPPGWMLMARLGAALPLASNLQLWHSLDLPVPGLMPRLDAHLGSQFGTATDSANDSM